MSRVYIYERFLAYSLNQQQYTMIYTVFCLIHGELLRNAFVVQIDRSETVSVLKELIVGKNPNYFKGIDARQLCLWKADFLISSGQNAVKQLDLADSNMLDPFTHLIDIYKPYPYTKRIHFIVKAPKQNGTFQL